MVRLPQGCFSAERGLLCRRRVSSAWAASAMEAWVYSVGATGAAAWRAAGGFKNNLADGDGIQMQIVGGKTVLSGRMELTGRSRRRATRFNSVSSEDAVASTESAGAETASATGFAAERTATDGPAMVSQGSAKNSGR